MKTVKWLMIMVIFGLIGAGIVSAQSFREDSMMASMAIYEDYGLTYNTEIQFFCFNNKTVGYFADEYRGIMHLNPSGEIFLKVSRGPSGIILAITELTAEEYAAARELLDEMEAKIITLNERRMELTETRERLNQNRLLLNPVPPRVPLHP